jgi:hypothetical protein
MIILTIDELMLLTRDELCALVERLELTLRNLEPGSAARTEALASLASIRRIMLRRGFHF